MHVFASSLIWLHVFLWSCGLSTSVTALPVDDTASVARAATTLPSDDPFYTPPAGFESTVPGTILKSRPVPAPVAAFGLIAVPLASAQQLLFRTTDSFGNATATVSTVLVPVGADFNKLLSFQNAEDSAYLNCAPSYAIQLLSSPDGFAGTGVLQVEVLLIAAGLQQGWVVTLPDHLGPKAAFLANVNSAHATLDGIRATLASTALTGVQPGATITMWGYSGGSVASARAAELLSTYAPELRIAGAVLGGTVPDILSSALTVNKGPFAGLIPSGFLGLTHEYPAVAAILDAYFVEPRKAAFLQANSQCLGQDLVQFALQDVIGTYFKDDSFLYLPVVTRMLGENNLGNAAPSIPVFIYKAIGDEISLIADTDKLYNQYCAKGANVRYQRDLVSEHAVLLAAGVPSAISWLKARMDGIPAPSGCSQADVLTSLVEPEATSLLGTKLVTLLQGYANRTEFQLFAGSAT